MCNSNDPVIRVSVKDCARCGGNHGDLRFMRFARPVVDDQDVAELTHWAMCPANEEPILMRVMMPDE